MAEAKGPTNDDPSRPDRAEGPPSSSSDYAPTELSGAPGIGPASMLADLGDDLSAGVRLKRSASDEVDLVENGDSARYQRLRILGEGGMGTVYLAEDRDLHRQVALKMILDDTERHRSRFIEEAQILGQLEHPNIVPLHDLSTVADGPPFCTQRFVRGRTLHAVISGLRHRDEEMERSYSLTQLMQILLQMAQAMAYAHDRHVVHRDLKPANVMLGEHGEVQIVDWGLAKVLTADPAVDQPAETVAESSVALDDEPPRSGTSLSGIVSQAVRTDSTGERTRFGQVVGTPSYMAPEQAMGREVDHRADVYALGVILYELLTLRRPIKAENHDAMIWAVVSEQPKPPSQRTPNRNIPEELEELCLRALKKRPEDRVGSAGELATEVQAWLEATEDKTKRKSQAAEKTEVGRAKLARYQQLGAELSRLRVELRDVAATVKHWQPLAERAELFEAEKRVEEAELLRTRAASETVTALSEALGFDPAHPAAREALSDYYWDRFLTSEADGNTGSRAFFGELVSAYHGGKYTRELQGHGTLALTSEPSGAEVWLFDQVETDFQLVATGKRLLGRTPLNAATLPMGSYLVELRKAGFRTVNYPVFITRNKDWTGQVTLYTDDEIGEDFLNIPASSFIEGGDKKAYTPAPRSEPMVEDFFIARHPITKGEYLGFLNDLAEIDGIEEARKRCPRRTASGGSFLDEIPAGESPRQFALPEIDPDGHPWTARDPVFSISFNDAKEYCAWRSRRDGRRYRLPTSPEWEKAARGVDGRWFPWGTRFDASLCNIQGSQKTPTQAVPVDRFPGDVSVYGVRGMAGNLFDMTETFVTIGESRQEHYVRGGGWINNPNNTRLASRKTSDVDRINSFVGFRLALTAPRARDRGDS